MLKLIVLFLMICSSQLLYARITLIEDKLLVDYSKSEDVFHNKELRDKIVKAAKEIAIDNHFHKKPLALESINLVLNPVLQSKKFNFLFRFNLKSEDGEILNCIGVADKEFKKFSSGCYQSVRSF